MATKIPTGSLLLDAEQQTAFRIQYWDSAFTPLSGDLASDGIALSVRQPLLVKTWSAYAAALKVAPAALTGAGSLGEAFADDAVSVATVASGRVPNVLESWSAGAPAWYGVTQRARLAIRWSMQLRPPSARSWFSSLDTPPFSLAVAGSGWIRILKTVNGVTSEVLVGGAAGYNLTETGYLTDGLVFTEVIDGLSSGDALDIFYVQNAEQWGGLVVKAVAGTEQTQDAARAAGVLGCGLFDAGSPPESSEWPHAESVTVTHGIGEASQAEIRLPLVNPAIHDGFGYEWQAATNTVALWDNGQVVATYKRGRLVRVSGGLLDDQRVLFTGTIADFDPSADGRLVVKCVGFEQRALRTIIKNEPDFVSYMTFGYKRLKGTLEPIYGISAYDNWAIEYAIADVLYRAGIDAGRLAAPLTALGPDGSDVEVEYGGETFRKFRARSVLGKLLKTERPIHYGNVGLYFDDTTPVDDPYIFKPEDSREPWSRVREIADRYGYDVRFDEFGDAVLSTRCNASAVTEVDPATMEATGLGTQVVKPSAFAGTVIEWSGAEAPTVSFTFTGSRLDVSMPRGPDLGAWDVLRVTRVSDGKVMGQVVNFDPYAAVDTYYYDYAVTPEVTNSTLVTVFSDAYDDYRLDAVGAALGPDGKIRRMDAFFVYAKDPLTPQYPAPLSTGQNAMSAGAVGGASEDMRNLVYVIGARKTAATDSEKFATNPNNPDPEFIVESAVDVASITDPTAANFLGGKSEAAIFDSSIADPDFAAYLARTFVYRYRTLRPAADVNHTILPVLQLRDALYADDATFRTLDPTATVWCTRYTHAFEQDGRAETRITTVSWPEFPSYEPREDVDIDALFNGLPITNVEVAYTSLTGHDLVNMSGKTGAGSGVVHESKDDEDTVTVTVPVTLAGTNGARYDYLDMTGQPWPPVPGTVFLIPPAVGSQTPDTYGDYPDFVNGSWWDPDQTVDARPDFRMDPGGSLDWQLPTGQVLTSVILTAWRLDVDGVTYLKDRRLTIGQTPTDEFWYHWNRDKKIITVHWNAGVAARQTSPSYFSLTAGFTTVDSTVRGGMLSDNPYHHFMNVDYRDSHPVIELPWQQGDCWISYHRNLAVSNYTVKYRRLGPWEPNQFTDPYNGVSPFADPMASDLGYVARITFDSLITGLYRISVRSVYDDTVVAWLTEPTADPTDQEAHWSYVTSGPGRVYEWDFVDQVGTWNVKQSEEYSAMLQGFFELEEKEPVGAGWVVWNREPSSGQTAPLALISGDRDALGRPIFGQGTYAAWYFQVEAKNDRTEELYENDRDGLDGIDPKTNLPYSFSPRPPIRTARTREPKLTNEVPPIYTTPDATSALVYTHLPEPTQAEIEVKDWISFGIYDPLDAAATDEDNWGFQYGTIQGSTHNTIGIINNGKPTRMRFTVKERPGALWDGKQDLVRCKVTRHVHARALIFDQFNVGEGIDFPDTAVEARTVYSRRECIDDHTLTYPDPGWRAARTFRNAVYPTGTVEWVFRPQDFKKQFTTIPNESIRFGDYLQLTEVPKWDAHRVVAGTSSRYIIGFWGMLFYLSAYVQDISGRRTWCTNRRFLDKSKITRNAIQDWWDDTVPSDPTAWRTASTDDTYRAPWPDDPLRQQRRTIVTRQWDDEPGWQQGQRDLWGITPGSIWDLLLRHYWTDHDPTSGQLWQTAPWPALDADYHTEADYALNRLPSQYHNLHRQLGTATTTRLTSTIGRDWTWEEGPTWVPCVTRDFHPYYLLPPMPNPASSLENSFWYAIVDSRRYTTKDNTGGDAAASNVWNSRAVDMTDTAHASLVPGTKVDKKDFDLPFGGHIPVNDTMLDYVRQNDLVHFEDLRGSYSRGPRPQEQPKKVSPVQPYYINLYQYDQFKPEMSLPQNHLTWNGHKIVGEDEQGHITVITNHYNTDVYRYISAVTNWFRMTFRSEYVVESPAYFPTDRLGLEVLAGLQADRTRFVDVVTRQSIRYDNGAWTGWKDDLTAPFLGGSVLANIFESPAMAVQTGPVMPVTQHVIMHLCLVNERRAVPVP
jgi:hypothetical protein